MAMTRDNARAYVAGSLTELIADAGLGVGDVPGELGEIIDDALLMTGTAYDDLATATVGTDIMGFRAVLTYAALLRIADARGDAVASLSEGGASVSWNRDGWAKRLEAARLKAEPFIQVSGAFEVGTVSLDFLEPVPAF